MTERKNRWVYPIEEVRAAERRYAEPKMSGMVAESAQVIYESDPAAIAELLPPPLQSGARPEVWVSVGRIPQVSLGVAQVAVACRYGDEDGWYCLHLPMSAEAAVVGGRDCRGDPRWNRALVFETGGGR